MMTEEELRKLMRELTDDQIEELMESRGGCSCHDSPPCPAHSDPLTLEEALELGFIGEVTQ
jgi:uncharacterized protein (DUF779 family)